jgi:putative hydrolase of HD superfamily
MDVKNYLELINLGEKLKNNTRHSYTSLGRHESVAEHSWRLTLMAMFIKDEFPEADIDRVIRMCIVHDMGEAFTGDIPSFEKTEKDEGIEMQRLVQWVSGLPQPYKTELKELYAEMDALETVEAKLYKALDKLEVLIQHDEADISTWLPLEYELQLTYGQENIKFSQYLKELRKQIDLETLSKIKDSKACS